MLFRLLGRIIAPWLQIRREPVAADAALVLPDLPVCYAIERYGLSNVLILEQACREAGLPSPLVEMPTSTSPGWPRASTWRAKTSLKP